MTKEEIIDRIDELARSFEAAAKDRLSSQACYILKGDMEQAKYFYGQYIAWQTATADLKELLKEAGKEEGYYEREKERGGISAD